MSKKLLLVALTTISNPVVLAAVGIGAIGMMLFSKEEDQNNGSEAVPDGSEPLTEPLNGHYSMVIEPLKTVELTVEETVNPAVEEPFNSGEFDDFSVEPQQDEAPNEDDLKKEVIRQAMSELGKRSAAARAKKRRQ